MDDRRDGWSSRHLAGSWVAAIRRSGPTAGEAFPVWLMLLLGLGGAIEVALIITVVRTRMWLALRV